MILTENFPIYSPDEIIINITLLYLRSQIDIYFDLLHPLHGLNAQKVKED